MNENRIICGPALETLKAMSSESINCCISSPPYWALRDYGVAGQLGLEKTFEEYIDKLCGIYDEVKRVLRKDGTCWVNLGDCYSSSASGKGSMEALQRMFPGRDVNRIKTSGEMDTSKCGIPAKSLCLIPQRFAIEMVNRGWILRNTIIWHKPNPMPSSAKDRFTVDFEYVYFFVKQKKYFFEPIYEPSDDKQERVYEQGGNWVIDKSEGQTGRLTNWKDKEYGCPPLGRNKRTVWTIPTQAYPDAHFATFPEKLVEPMILSGCPKEVCSKCGQGRRKVYDVGELVPDGTGQKSCSKHWLNDDNRTKKDKGWNLEGGFAPNMLYDKTFKGYTDCGCGAEFRPGIVLDPFMGSGTVGKVAAQNGRNWLGIELKAEYIEMAKRRINEGETGIPVKEQKYQLALFGGNDASNDKN